MLWEIFCFALFCAFIVGLYFSAPLAWRYIRLWLAKKNILWTIIEQGWCKIVLMQGEYCLTLGPGLRWMGLPGICALYKRKMVFFKSTTDASGNPIAEPHDDKDVSSFKTTEYAYAFPFKDEEDSHGLPLSGILAVLAIIMDYEKAFFKVSDWYSFMNTKIMSYYRDVLVRVSYDDDIVGRNTKEEQAKQTIGELLWEALNRKVNGKQSVLEEIFNVCGIRINSVELRSVDPPAEWRATTLAPYKALREKEAAVHQAAASATLFDDTNQALEAWLRSQRAAGNDPTKSQIEAKQDELRQRALAKTPGYQQIHIKGLEGASTAVVGGGSGTGVLVGGNSNQKNPQGSGDSGGKPTSSLAGKTEEELADIFFTNNKKYPKWDPKKRTPN